MKFKTAISVVIASLLGNLAFAGTYQQTIEVYNNSSNAVDVITGNSGSDIMNLQKRWNCSGDPHSGSATACVSISPTEDNIPSKSSQIFTLDSTVKSLSGVASLNGSVNFYVNGSPLRPNAQVNVPIEVNPIAVFATNVTPPDSMNQIYLLGAASLNNQVQHTPVIASVEYQNTGSNANKVTIVVNDNAVQ